MGMQSLLYTNVFLMHHEGRRPILIHDSGAKILY